MNQKGLGIISLISLVIGAMIGGGIFSIPQNAAAESGAGGAMIAWIITAVGMLTLAFVFMDLSKERPDLDTGVYSYAKEGFGNLIGFSSAWGYWISAVLGNVSYIVLVFQTFSYFFPIFGDGNSLYAIVGSSLLLWALHFMISAGIKEAAFVNIITTISKIVPLIIFIVACIISFNVDKFTQDFWVYENKTIFEQVKGMMMLTVWVFIGIEGASLFSKRARNRKDIALATIIGFLFVLSILILVNMLSFGIMNREDLAALSNPSTSYVLEAILGEWGIFIMSGGLIISLLGALIAWILFSAEVLYAASIDKNFPNFLKKENKKLVPINSLFLSNLVLQLFLIMTYFFKETYTSLFYLATSMVLLPYFFSAAFGFKHSMMKKDKSFMAIFIYIIAVIYSIWLVYAAGLKYLLLSSILYVCGLPLYLKAANENKVMPFKGYERLILLGLLLAAISGGYMLYEGNL